MKFNSKKFLQPIPVIKLLPNLVTLIGLIIGISSIRFAIDGTWESSVYCILVATVIDAIDGRVARMFNASSHFGAELDSLCDFVNFGLCPAILIYLWSLQQYEYKLLSWISFALFVVCMAIRLARFNVDLTKSEEQEGSKKTNSSFFMGVPAPVGAILVLVPLILDFEITSFIDNFTVRNHTLVIDLYTIIIALLLPSRLKTISLKGLYIKPEYLSLTMMIFAIIIVALLIYPWYILPFIAVIYILSIPIFMSRSRSE